MVRTYKRKTERGSYGLQNLQIAIEKVRNGEISKKKAEGLYGVPRKTITRHLRGEVKEPGTLGRFKPVLGHEFETALMDHALQLQQMLFGFTTVEFRKLAYELAERLGIQHPFSHDTKMAGRDWLTSFLRRHKEISLRDPEPTSIARAVGFNKPSVDRFFSVYKQELEKDNFTAQQVWNVDETGLTPVHKPGKILAKTGQKQVGKITSGEKGETMTVVSAVSAGGAFVPPMLIFKRKRMSELLLKGSPPGTIGGVSANGWIDMDLFLQWLKHFVKNVKPTPDNKALIVMDGHVTHKSLAVIEYARQNSVVMLCLPPHTTHRMQPLDKTVFGPLKTAYNAACDKFMVSHPGRRISAYDQAELFTDAYLKVATMKNAITGFSSTGLWPFNPDVFSESDFAPSLITDEPPPQVAAPLTVQPLSGRPVCLCMYSL